MMRQEGNTPYRFYRPRRPGGMYGEGLRLEGVTNKFGLIAITMLIIVGIAMLLMRNTIRETDLAPVSVEVQAPPYHIAKLHKSVLLSLTGAKVLALDPATFAAADSSQLFSLKKGDQLNAWLTKTEADKWNAGTGKKDFYKAILLQKSNGEWMVDYASYRKKVLGSSSQGWWMIILGLLLIPYQILQKTKLPVWAALFLYATAVILFYLL